ncbi:MAG TPA: hypothetical protein DCE71_05735 [Parachlamydiales bacterium]|nr:hypothetical protein [Parachlamydiales bacterium]
MKKSYLMCGFVVCFATCFSGCNKNKVEVTKDGSDSEQSSDSTTEYVQPVIWTGPGWYYGIWFSTEVDFNTWNHHHYHYRDHDHHDRHNDHHDRHRDNHRDAGNNRRRNDGSRHPNAGNRHDGGENRGGGGGHHEKGRK